MSKCSFTGGIRIMPDGINELDPCIYETIEYHTDVTVEVRRCQRCGNIDIAWYRTDDTKDYILTSESDGGDNV